MWARRDSRPLGLSQTQGRVKTITQPALNLIAVNPRVHKKVGDPVRGRGGCARAGGGCGTSEARHAAAE